MYKICPMYNNDQDGAKLWRENDHCLQQNRVSMLQQRIPLKLSFTTAQRV